MPRSDDPTEAMAPSPLVTRQVFTVSPQTGPAGMVREDTIAAEVPVALVFNGISHAVMMATPSDLHAFALGFALSEGLIDSPADCYDIEVHTASSAAAAAAGLPTACEVHLEIASRCFVRLKERRRALAGRTGCGICGIDSLEALDIVPDPITPRDWVRHMDAATVLRAIDAMPARQKINAAAGAVHAAGWATPDGQLRYVLEDVGRHNALDKLLGHLALQKRLGKDAATGEDGFVVMSSRASYELVRKCSRLDIPLLATISAPTSLALDIAERAGLQLWGLCRSPKATRYVPAAWQASA